MIKHCQWCNSEFIPQNRSDEAYCSDDCRKQMYRHRSKLAQRSKRKHEKVMREMELQEERKRLADKKEEEYEQQQKKRTIELQKKLDAGDPFTLMMSHSNDTIEYWEAYKRYEMEYEETSGRKRDRFIRLINGIPIYEHNFAIKVANSVKELGHIKGELMDRGSEDKDGFALPKKKSIKVMKGVLK